MHRGKFNSKFSQFDGNISLQASSRVLMVSPLLFIEDSFENLVLSGYSIFILCIISLSILIIVFAGKKGKGKAKQPELPAANLTVADQMNQIAAAARCEPDKYVITKKLCQQYITNHAQQAETPHDEFTPLKPNCHMDETHIARFSSIVTSIPWTHVVHDNYKVERGVVCYKDTSLSVRAEFSIIRWIALYEGSEGKLPKINQLREDMSKLDEQDAKDGKWDYRRGLPPRE